MNGRSGAAGTLPPTRNAGEGGPCKAERRSMVGGAHSADGHPTRPRLRRVHPPLAGREGRARQRAREINLSPPSRPHEMIPASSPARGRVATEPSRGEERRPLRVPSEAWGSGGARYSSPAGTTTGRGTWSHLKPGGFRTAPRMKRRGARQRAGDEPAAHRSPGGVRVRVAQNRRGGRSDERPFSRSNRTAFAGRPPPPRQRGVRPSERFMPRR